MIDVSLTTVKVQNWDKTITTIPTYTLISDSFKNWRGMSESGGRRIKRALHIDLRSVQFADEAQLERFKQIKILKPYLESKLAEIQQHNDDVSHDLAELINGRRLTNIGTFRAYCLAYLRNHPKIHHQGMTLLVRQLPPQTKACQSSSTASPTIPRGQSTKTSRATSLITCSQSFRKWASAPTRRQVARIGKGSRVAGKLTILNW